MNYEDKRQLIALYNTYLYKDGDTELDNVYLAIIEPEIIDLFKEKLKEKALEYTLENKIESFIDVKYAILTVNEQYGKGSYATRFSKDEKYFKSLKEIKKYLFPTKSETEDYSIEETFEELYKHISWHIKKIEPISTIYPKTHDNILEVRKKFINKKIEQETIKLCQKEYIQEKELFGITLTLNYINKCQTELELITEKQYDKQIKNNQLFEELIPILNTIVELTTYEDNYDKEDITRLNYEVKKIKNRIKL